jgi:hypothetical protein
MHERRLGHCKAASRLVLLSPQLEDLFQFDPKKGPFIVLPVPAWVNVKQFSSGSRPGTHEYQSDVSGHSCMRTTFKVGHCVCREYTNRKGGVKTVREMREGPSEPAIRGRLQTTASCWR